MELLVLAVLGVILAVLSLFILMRKIESAIFYTILLGPALGTSIGGFLINLFAGDMMKAVESFKFLPFFLAPIDQAFFSLGANQLLVVMGAVILGLWVYVLLHFMTGKFGVWAFPMLPSILWLAGMTLPNIRLQLTQTVPMFSLLTEPLFGLLGLLLTSFFIGFFSYLWWRHSQPELELPLPSRLRL